MSTRYEAWEDDGGVTFGDEQQIQDLKGNLYTFSGSK